MKRTRRRCRPKLIGAGVVLLFLGATPIIWLASAQGARALVEEYTQIDLNSGLERCELHVAGIRLRAVNVNTPLADAIARSGGPLGEPVWAPAFYHGGTFGPRVHYRHGGTVTMLRMACNWLEGMDMPAAERDATLRAALAAARDEDIDVYGSFDPGEQWVQVTARPRRGGPERVVAEWREDDEDDR